MAAYGGPATGLMKASMVAAVEIHGGCHDGMRG